MKKGGASGQRRRLLWVVLLVCLVGVPVLLYAMLPVVAGIGLRYFLEQQGYHHVVVQLGYPGWRLLQVPLLKFHKDLDGETLAVTVQDSQIEYNPGTLLSGRVHRLHVPHAAVAFHAQPNNEGQPCTLSRTSQAGPGLLAGVTVGQLLHPVPALPVRTLVLDLVHVWRECATGPLRDVRISGQIHQAGAAVEGAVVLQGQGGTAYRLQVTMPHAGSLEAALYTAPVPSGPIVLVQSQLRQEPAGMQVVGKVSTDFAQLAPFLAVLLPLGGDLQHVAGSLHAEWTATAPLSAALDTAWRQPAAVLSGSVALSLQLPEVAGLGKKLAIQLQADVRGKAQQLTWTLHQNSRLAGELDPAIVALPEALHWLLPSLGRHVVLECLEPLQGTVRLSNIPLQFTIAGPVRAQYGIAPAPVQMEVVVHRVSGQGITPLMAEGAYRFMGTLEHVPPDILDVNKVQWDIHGTLALDKQQAGGTVEASSFVSLAGVHTAGLTVPAATVQLTESLPLSVQLKTRQWSGAPAQVNVQIPQALWQDMAGTIKQAHLALHRLQGESGRWQTEGVLRLTDVAAQLPTMVLPVTQWELGFTADASAFRLQAQGTALQNTVTWSSHLEYLWATRAGTAELHLGPVQFASPGVPWKTALASKLYPFDVTEGRLSAMASLRWDARAVDHGPLAVRGSATIILDHLSGFYNNVLVNGLSTTLRFEAAGPDTFSMPEPAIVTIAAVQAGIDITDVALHFQLGWQPPSALPWVEFRDVSAALLGGKVTSDGLRFERAEPRHALSIKVEHIDMQQLLQLEQQQGLVGTGLLDGVMPVMLTPTGIQVQDGVLEARPPGGILQYRPAPGTAPTLGVAPTQLQLMLQALENFHYTVLKIQVQYAEDGTLFLAARLEGKNPDWQEGRPVHFNLTVQENIPALLRTLQIIQGIPQAIENRLQRR